MGINDDEVVDQVGCYDIFSLYAFVFALLSVFAARFTIFFVYSVLRSS